MKRWASGSLFPPVALFDPSHYRLENKLSGLSHKLPTLHYLLFSTSAQRENAHPLFDYQYMREQCREQGLPITPDLLRTYLSDRAYWRLDPHILFDTKFYTSNRQPALSRAPLLDYYLQQEKAPDPHPLFSQEWYLGRNPHIRNAVSASGSSALSHFQTLGYKKGELPNPYFHTIWYANSYLARDRASTNPLIEYLQSGHAQGNQPSCLFDASGYTGTSRHGTPDPLSHYLSRNPLSFPAKRNRLTDMFWPTVGVQLESKPSGNEQPEKRLIVLFTPRSGSTWLTGLIKKTGQLGHPAEWFNYRLIHNHSRAMGYYASSLDEYITAIQSQRKGRNGVFSVELSHEHLLHLEATKPLTSLFPGAAYCLLYREDLVAQAVSLYLATESGYFHSAQGVNRKHQPAFSSKKIMHWLHRLLQQENALLSFLSEHNLPCLLLSYESLQASPLAAVQAIADLMAEPVGGDTMSSLTAGQRNKISNDLNRQYCAQFREMHANAVARVEKQRLIATSPNNN